MEFITQNIGTIAVLAVLILVVGLVLFKLRRDKKQGKGSCGCGCEGCAMRGQCHKDNS